MLSERQRFLDALPGLVWTAGPDGRVRLASRRWKEWRGPGDPGAIDFVSQASLHPDDRAHALARWQTIVGSGQPGEFEARTRHADGSWRSLLHRLSPVTDESGSIVEWCGISTELAAHGEEGFRAIWETTPECVKVIARDGTVLRANAAGVAMSGAPSEAVLLGKCFYDFVVPAHRERYVAFNETVCDGQRGFLEFDLINAQGRLYHMETHAAPMHHVDGSIVQLGVTRDITVRRTSEEALGQARAELAHMARIMSMSALAASIAHEVNQPLSGIITNASTGLRMLAAVPPNVEGALETLRRTLRDGNRAADVVHRLRSLYARKAPTLEALDLNDATREAIALSASDLQRGRVALHARLAQDLPPVMGDRIQLQQVLSNLLRNAVDAMIAVEDRPRELTIETTLGDGEQAHVSLRDTGVGLDPAELDRLFQPFHSSKPGGMGIGLSISRTIIEHHQGRLWASPNEGYGATFSFSIPAA